MVKKMP